MRYKYFLSLLFFVSCLLRFSNAYAADPPPSTSDTAEAVFDAIETANAWVDNLNSTSLSQVPFGINTTIKGTKYQVAFASVSLTPTGGKVRAFARVITPQLDENGDNQMLYFEGGLDISRSGGIISDGKLNLVEDGEIDPNKHFSISLLRTNLDNGQHTYFKTNCQGFVELGLTGYVMLNKSIYQPITTDDEVIVDTSANPQASFAAVLTGWDRLYVGGLLFDRSFRLKDLSGYAFTIKKATLDMSDYDCANGEDPWQKYLERLDLPDNKVWHGLYINEMNVNLPKQFRPAEADESKRTSLTDGFAVIDDGGFTTMVSDATGIVKLGKYKKKGFSFSIDSFRVSIHNSKFDGGGLSGRILLPICKDTFNYRGDLNSQSGTEIAVSYNKPLIDAAFMKSKFTIDSTSTIGLVIKPEGWGIKTVLNGSLSFNVGANPNDTSKTASTSKKDSSKFFNCKGIEFEELTLQTVSPYLEVKSFGTSGNLAIGGVEAEYEVGLKSDKPADLAYIKDDIYSLHFGLGLKLMEKKIVGNTSLNILATYGDDGLKYFDWRIDSITVGADFGKVKFDGTMCILRNDPIYGDAFSGKFKLGVNDIQVAAQGIFGSVGTNRYWSVDASVSGFSLRSGPITWTGFCGGASYHMSIAPKSVSKLPSGALYVPDSNSFLRVRAGALFNVVNKKAVFASAGLQMSFNKNWGIDSFYLTGTAKSMSTPNAKDTTTDCIATMTGTATASTIDTNALVYGALKLNFDFVNSAYTGTLDAYANLERKVVGAGDNYYVGRASFYIGKSMWYFNLGTDVNPLQFKIKESPIEVNASGYFMLGNNMQAGGDVGFGVKHGANFWWNIDADADVAYARFTGSVHYDFFVFHNDNFMCAGQKAGINGWYGSGVIGGNVAIAAGVRFWDHEYDVINITRAFTCTFQGFDPSYFKVELSIPYDVGCCYILHKSGTIYLEKEWGTYCKIN